MRDIFGGGERVERRGTDMGEAEEETERKKRARMRKRESEREKEMETERRRKSKRLIFTFLSSMATNAMSPFANLA